MKRLLLIVCIVWCVFTKPYAQDGPGGVGLRNGVSALKVWLDASEVSTFSTTAGNAIFQWKDKSGSANHLTTIGGWSAPFPVFSANAVNGNGTVQLRGEPLVNTAMSSSAGATPDIFSVIKINAFNNSGIAICNPDNSYHQGTYQTGSSGFYGSNASSGALIVGPASFPISQFGITNFYYGLDLGSNQSIMSL